MTIYESNVSGNLFEAFDGIGDKLGYQIYLFGLEGRYNNYSTTITPSDLALGFTKVEAPDRYITSDGHVAVKGTSLPPFISPTPSDSLVGKRFTSEWGDVTVLFANDVWVVYSPYVGRTPTTRSRPDFLDTFTEVTGE